MTTTASHYRGTYRHRPYHGNILTAELSLRFDYKWSEDMFLDVTVACEPLTQKADDGSTYDVKPAVTIDGLVLPVGAPQDQDFRKLDHLQFEFHQPIDPDGGRLFELDAPGSIYFGQWQQIDDLSMRLRYLGHAEFHITLSGTAEEDTFEVETIARFVDATMLHRGTAAKAADMEIVINPDAIEATRKSGHRWIDLPHPSERALSAFARRLRVNDYALETRVDVNDLNVDVIGHPLELLHRRAGKQQSE